MKITKIKIKEIIPIFGDDPYYPEFFNIHFENGLIRDRGKSTSAYYIMAYLNCTGTIGDGIELIDKIEAFESIQFHRNEEIARHYHIKVKKEFNIIDSEITI